MQFEVRSGMCVCERERETESARVHLLWCTSDCCSQKGGRAKVQVVYKVNSLGKMPGMLCIMAKHHCPPDKAYVDTGHVITEWC